MVQFQRSVTFLLISIPFAGYQQMGRLFPSHGEVIRKNTAYIQYFQMARFLLMNNKHRVVNEAYFQWITKKSRPAELNE